MKLDTSSYYPEPLLPPEDDNKADSDTSPYAPSSYPDKEETEESADMPDTFTSEDKAMEETSEESNSNQNSKDGQEGGFLNAISTLLCWGLVPLLMPVYGMLLMFDLTVLSFAPTTSKWMFTLVVFIINCAIPMLLVILLKKLGVVQDYGLNGRRERLVPYIITFICMGITAWYMGIKGAPMWTCMFFAGGAVAALVNLTVNFRWKISAHAAGIAGVIALLVHLGHENFRQDNSVLAWLVVWVILAGLLGSARIWLGRHTLAQVLAGTAVGFCSVYFLVTFI